MRTIFRGSSVVAPIVLSACALWLVACHGSIPEQVLSKPGPSIAVAAPSVRDGPWLFHPTPQRRAYVVDQHAALTITQDTLTRIDSVSSHAELAFTVFAGTGRVTGSVSVFRVRDSAREPATPAGLVLPLAFGADHPTRGRQLVFTAPGPVTACTSLGLAVAQSLRDLWFQPPDTLRLGTTWADSASFLTCRDGVPLRTMICRTFRVTGATESSGHTVLSLSRASRTALEGEGQQSGEPMSVTGSGTGELTYVVDPASGEILSARGSATLDLSLQSRLRTQRVRQTSDIRIARGP